MSQLLTNLLAADMLAQQFGVSLNPKLRTAIVADLSFSATSAGPIPNLNPQDIPDGVIALPLNAKRAGAA